MNPAQTGTRNRNLVFMEPRIYANNKGIKFVPASQEKYCRVSREVFAVYSENHIEHINAQCGQNPGFMSTKAGEIKIKLPLCVIKTYGRVWVYLHICLTPTRDGG